MSIIRTGLPILVELIDPVNSVIIFLCQMTLLVVNFPTWIPDCDSHNPALLDLFLSSDASICSTMTFPPTNSQQDAPFHRIASDYSHANLDGLRDHVRDVP